MTRPDGRAAGSRRECGGSVVRKTLQRGHIRLWNGGSDIRRPDGDAVRAESAQRPSSETCSPVRARCGG